MSEFSESFHLLTDDRTEAEALVRQSGLTGWTLPPSSGGWTPVVIDRDFTGEPDDHLVQANTGVLVLYVCAEDHGCELTVWSGAETIGHYRAEWTEEVEVEDHLDPATVQAAIGDRVEIDAAELEAALSVAVIESSLDPASGVRRAAAALGLGPVDWLSAAYLRHDAAERDAVHVG